MYFTAEQLAERWNCSVQKIYAMKDRGEIPFTKLGRSVRFPKKEIEEYEQNNTIIPEKETVE